MAVVHCAMRSGDLDGSSSVGGGITVMQLYNQNPVMEKLEEKGKR